ncbi:MAG: DUF4760 domain-containing protein [Longimicrobiales bacterium]|nr:DUF4760 domain-containing protein [Longimicrobiales bacterium]
MDLVGVAEVVSAVAVVFGLGFAVSEVKRYRTRRARESALALVNAYQTPEFARAVVLIIELDEALERAELERRLGQDMRLISLLMTTWESLGILVHRGEVSLDLVDDFFSGAIVLSWRKLEAFVRQMRSEGERETYFEWFQWLAERMIERETETVPIPAHIEHANWRPRR